MIRVTVELVPFGHDEYAKRCHCDGIATVYAMDTIPGGWGDYYCDDHTPKGWITEKLGKD